MRKLLFPILFLILFVIGCENMMNTPTMKVEHFFSNYQKMDSSVLKELDLILEKENTMTEKQKSIYKELLKRQYQNLSYKIKSEETTQNQAIIEVEIEVLNYHDAIEKAKKEWNENRIEESNYLDYQLEEMQKVEDSMKYSFTIYLTKTDGVWVMENLTEMDRQKIHGLY